MTTERGTGVRTIINIFDNVASPKSDNRLDSPKGTHGLQKSYVYKLLQLNLTKT